MNITFTIMAHGLEKAGQIEKALKELGVPYDAKEAKSVAKANGYKRNARVTKTEVMAVTTALAAHPDMSYTAISKQCGVHDQTVSKIAKGIHPLQTKGNLVSIKKDKK